MQLVDGESFLGVESQAAATDLDLLGRLGVIPDTAQGRGVG
jgi:hypothetical protein